MMTPQRVDRRSILALNALSLPDPLLAPTRFYD